MNSRTYIGMDVHKKSISIAVRNDAGKIVMECVVVPNARTCFWNLPVFIFATIVLSDRSLGTQPRYTTLLSNYFQRGTTQFPPPTLNR